LVTGAGKRVGRAIALALADAGCDVAIHFNRSAAEAAEVASMIARSGYRGFTIQADLASPPAVGALARGVLESLGGLDILVNNASEFAPDPGGGFDSTFWARMFQVNVLAPAALIAATEAALADDHGGVVINLCDIAAERPWRGYMAYCASKAALVNVTQAAARKLAPRVRVNGISPGIALFPESYDGATREKLVKKVPLDRAGSPDDVARTVRFLVEEGDYITGEIIRVDGGRSLA
jgi:pteridine reductase